MDLSDPAARRADEIERVIEDVESRTLPEMRGYFSRLIYLASLRNYNTGRYHHEGLESRYSSEAIDEGLCRCHAKVFEKLLALDLGSQTQDLLGFFESLKEERSRLVETWQHLRSYKVLPPEKCAPLARDLFESNVEIILTILQQTDLWPLLHDPHRDADNLT